jgi:hypothetical protein
VGYTRNFGFRSFENVIRDGRHRVPKDSGGYEIGSAVTVDPSEPGFLTRPGDGDAPTQLSGLALFEHIQYQGVDPWLTSPQDPPFHLAPAGQYAQMVHGVGVKVWFRNLGEKTLYDGRTQDNTSLLADPENLPSVAEGLVPDENGKWRVVDDQADPDEVPWLLVEQVNPSTGVVECRLTF